MGELAPGAEFARRCESADWLENAKKRMRLDDYLELIAGARGSRDRSYQSLYRDFWGMNGVYLSDEACDVYFKLFSEVAAQAHPSFAGTLRELYRRLDTINAHSKVHAAFVSKMLATLDPMRPIWDSRVEAAFRDFGLVNLPARDANDAEVNLSRAIEGYSQLLELCRWFPTSSEGRECVAAFESAAGLHPEITDVKKIDYVLWTLGGQS